MTARHNFQFQRDASAFTIIELMVVVAIIMILISILLPSLQRTTALTRDTNCKVNLKNQFQGCYVYAMDHDGVLPLMKGRRRINGAWKRWNYMEDIREYGVKDKHYLCPAVDDHSGRIHTVTKKIMDYGINNYGYGAGVRRKDYLPNLSRRRISSVQNQSVVYLADAEYDSSPEDIGGISRGKNEWPMRWSFERSAYIRHDGNHNAASLDGSVRGYEGLIPHNEKWFIKRVWAKK